jgi:hypothetical protein
MFAIFTDASSIRPAHFGETAASSKLFGTFNSQRIGSYSGERLMAHTVIQESNSKVASTKVQNGNLLP